jgi:hypothetical protein
MVASSWLIYLNLRHFCAQVKETSLYFLKWTETNQISVKNKLTLIHWFSVTYAEAKICYKLLISNIELRVLLSFKHLIFIFSLKSLFNEKHIRKNLLCVSICMLLNITCLLALCNISHSVFWRAVVFTVAQIAVPRRLFPPSMYIMTCFQLEFNSNVGSNNYCNFFWSHGKFFDTVSYDCILLESVYFTVHDIALWKRHKIIRHTLLSPLNGEGKTEVFKENLAPGQFFVRTLPFPPVNTIHSVIHIYWFVCSLMNDQQYYELEASLNNTIEI